ncbi:MAG: DUF58 domain-containing protein [Propionicimonas sp.]|nr:DUF58 domain-containing protein [Propionicimonas sp.]
MASRSRTATTRRRRVPGPGLTLQGWVTLAGGVAWSVVAWLTGQRDLMWPGIFLIALPLSGWLLLAAGAGRPDLARTVTPREAAAGEEVVNRLVIDTDGFGLGAVASYHDERSPALRGPADATFPVAFGPGRHRVDQRLTPAWRGRHRLGPLHRSVVDALGLARSGRVLPGTIEVLALPAVHPLEPLREASGLGTAMDSAVLRTSLVGQDDVMVREYLPGDDVRRIHWRSTARTGELMVRREERAWDPSAALLLDNRAGAFSSAVPERRFEWLVSAAASISVHLLGHGFSVSVMDTDAAGADPANRQSQSARTILRRLAAVELSHTGDLARAVAASPTGVRGQLLIALLGRLDVADAGLLAEARRDHRSCWAVLQQPAEPAPDALRLLEAAGWRCLVLPPGATVPEAWQALGEVTA